MQMKDKDGKKVGDEVKAGCIINDNELMLPIRIIGVPANWFAENRFILVSNEKIVTKKSSQNGSPLYPDLLPHQLRPISTYPNPHISHMI